MESENLQYAMFSRGEMDRRYSKARRLMGDQDLDALFISGEENFQYFAGTSASLALHHSLTRPSMFVLPLDGEPMAITQGIDNLSVSSYVTEKRGYSEILSFPHETVLEVLNELGLNKGRVGVELGHEQRMGMPVGAYLALVEALPQTQFVDASDILIELRMVKSEEELGFIRRAADITGRARQRLFDLVRPDMTERDVVRLMRRMILEEGGDRTSFVILQLDLPGAKNQFSQDRPLRRGDVLAVDAGACVGMYTVDYARMATLGEATDLQKRVHVAVLEVNSKMAEALRPGVTCSDLHRIGATAMKDAGMEPDSPGRLKIGRMGHGQGILITEPPSIAPDDHTVLRPGMVISTEPGVRSGPVQFLWEDVHVITEDGHEQLTLETDELRELPF